MSGDQHFYDELSFMAEQSDDANTYWLYDEMKHTAKKESERRRILEMFKIPPPVIGEMGEMSFKLDTEAVNNIFSKFNPTTTGDKMSLQLHSKRPLVKPCAGCGATGLRWAHDTNQPQNETCAQCGVDGRLVLVDQKNTGHQCKPTEKPDVALDTEGADSELLGLAQKLAQANQVEGNPKMEGVAGPSEMDMKGEMQLPGEGSGECDQPDDDSNCHECCEIHKAKLDEHNARLNGAQESFNLQQSINDSTAKRLDGHQDKIRLTVQSLSALKTEVAQLKKNGGIYDAPLAGGPVKIEIVQDGRPVKELEESCHAVLPTVVKSLAAGINILMVGPAGTGKSHISRQAAKALDMAYYSIPLSPQTMTSSVLGYMQAQGKYVRTLFRDAYEKGGVFHFDEFDNAHPAVLAVINDGVASNTLAFPDRMVEKHADFRVVASANTYGRGPDRTYTGRQGGDAATWDRFAIIHVDYDRALEYALCRRYTDSDELVREVLRFVQKCRQNAIDHHLPIVISPRASMDMVKMIGAGIDLIDVVEARVRRGLSDQDWNKVGANVRFPELDYPELVK